MAPVIYRVTNDPTGIIVHLGRMPDEKVVGPFVSRCPRPWCARRFISGDYSTRA